MRPLSAPARTVSLRAGASKAAGVPDTYEFVSEFRRAVGLEGPDREALDGVIARLTSWGRRPVDIELLLDTLTRIADRDQDPGLLFCRDAEPSDPGLVAAAGRLSDALRSCIKRRTYVEPEQTAHLDPLMDFVRHHGLIDIATLNYDTVIEEFGERQRIPVHDGFLPDWSLASLQKADSGIRLYKLHGSVTWYETPDGRYVKDRARIETPRVKLVQAGESESLMLYPVRKWAYSEPMVGLLFEFKRLLEAPTTRFLVVVGYSFRDHHVQGVIRDATRHNRALEIVLVDPAAHAVRARLFDGTNSPAWPSHLRRRVLCLPYRFEAALPYMKHGYLKDLRAAVDGESDAEAYQARGEPALHWGLAAAAFGRCEHSERLAEVVRRANPLREDILGQVAADVVTAVNVAIGGGENESRAALVGCAESVRSHVVSLLRCEWDLAEQRSVVRLQRTDMSWWPGTEVARQFSELVFRVRRSVELAHRPRQSAVQLVAALAVIGEILRRASERHQDIESWLSCVACSPAEREAAVASVSRYRANGSEGDDGVSRREAGEALTRALRDGLTRLLDSSLHAPSMAGETAGT